MNVVYYCFGSAHSSIISAAIHLNRLPDYRMIEEKELKSLPDFDASFKDGIGTLYFKGHDEYGNKVFTLGVGAEQPFVIESIKSVITASGGNLNDYMFFQALPHINRMAKIGGALSRRYGWVHWGRSLCIKGIVQCYGDLIEFVKSVKAELRQTMEARDKMLIKG